MEVVIYTTQDQNGNTIKAPLVYTGYRANWATEYEYLVHLFTQAKEKGDEREENRILAEIGYLEETKIRFEWPEILS